MFRRALLKALAAIPLGWMVPRPERDISIGTLYLNYDRDGKLMTILGDGHRLLWDRENQQCGYSGVAFDVDGRSYKFDSNGITIV